MRTDLNDAAVRAYLLGLLPEGEAEALEEAYLGQPEVWERVRGVEDDLLDDYAWGRLEPAERGAFETRYLASPRLRGRVAAARALRMAAAGGTPVPAKRDSPPRWRVPLAIAAGVLLAVAAFWTLPARPQRVTSASPAPLTALPAPAAPTASETARPELAGPAPSAYPLPATPRGPTASRLVLAVSPILLRGEASPPELRIPPTVDTVAFELEGDPAVLPRPDSRLEVAIETVEGGLVWRGEARRAAGRRAPPLVASAAVPSRVLAAGDYLLTLSEPDGGGGPLYRYFVRVVP